MSKSVKVRELYDALSALWPESLSAGWDNDGLMCLCDEEAKTRRAVVALDATLPSILRAKEREAVLVTHHPMIFRGADSVVPGDAVSDRIIAAIRGNVAVMSFHTRLDAADGGVNDALAGKFGLPDVAKFGNEESPTLGRIGTLPSVTALDVFARAVRDALGSPTVRVTGDGVKKIRRVAVVGGSGGDFIGAALRSGADVLLTGDMGYNRAEDESESGKIAVIEAGHYFTEAPVLPVIAEAISSLGIETEIFDSNPQRVI